ncbi:hypothetical protein AXF42_Ash014367 [Apostasia shenzhenica]|uniref:RNase H type-1 domain-containing protein n=1 Tax=Apostasia shenzhenica TaxID=1088818 RepID=A0A2I0B0Y2_9ASPA|nr:hypothetical protein AXF42_Ash014367 [Apostasia shenzhenica]
MAGPAEGNLPLPSRNTHLLKLFLGNLQSRVQKNPADSQAIKWVGALYHSWRARNGRVHNKPFPLPRVIAALVFFSEAQEQPSSNVGNWDPNSLEGCCYPSASHWDPPPPRWIKVNFDGSVKQNGAAGAGGVLRDHCGNFLLATGYKLYTHATTTAEATGALIAMTATQEWADTIDGIWIEGFG